MVEYFLEIFMDDFFVFYDSFDNCLTLKRSWACVKRIILC
jgi:hypothetical protein